MNSHEHAIALSLAATITGAMLAGPLIRKWAGVLLKALRTKNKGPQDFFTIALSVQLFFPLLDQINWSTLWALVLFQYPNAGEIIKGGIYPNLPLRHAAFIVGCYLHLRGLFAHLECQELAKSHLNSIVIRAILGGATTWLVILLVKNGAF